MAYKFLEDTDFNYKIRSEILTVLKGAENPDTKLETAENAALAQVRHYIGHRYDLVTVFAKTNADRDAYMIQVIVNIMLYNLYGQTGVKDIPTHRKEDYGDVMKWLDKVGDGRMNADLPSLISATNPVDVRLNSKERIDWDY